jgi:DNA-binding response OmpR family regulator
MQGTSLAGRSILIVEDEPLIALDLVKAFQQAGAVVLAARSLDDATPLVEQDELSAAVVDFGLGAHNADALCVRLEQRNIPFVLHSGYSHHGPASRSGTVVRKPASPATLIETVVGLLR